MQKLILFIIAFCYSVIALSQKSTDNFSGKWKTQGGVIIEITKTEATFTGKPVGKNSIVLKNLTFSNNKWLGILINPKKNITAECEAYLQDNHIKFIVKKGFMSKEIIWTKSI